MVDLLVSVVGREKKKKEKKTMCRTLKDITGPGPEPQPFAAEFIHVPDR